MRRFETWRLMPHQAAFVVFIVATLGRLLTAQGSLSPLSLLYASLLTVLMAGVIWCRRFESETRWRIRLALYPLAMNVAYFTLGDVIPVFCPDKADALLQSIDARLIGGNASLWLEHFSHPVLTEILSICYLTFSPEGVIMVDLDKKSHLIFWNLKELRSGMKSLGLDWPNLKEYPPLPVFPLVESVEFAP